MRRSRYVFPTTANIMQTLRYRDHKNKSERLREFKGETNTIIEIGTLNNKEQAKPDPIVMPPTEAKYTKLQAGPTWICGKLKVRVHKRGDIQKRRNPTNERPTPTCSIHDNVPKCYGLHTARHKIKVLQLDVIWAMQQAKSVDSKKTDLQWG
jgi:hypothetical protein